MTESQVLADALPGKELVLFGDGEAATESLVDHLLCSSAALDHFLALVDEIAGGGGEAAAVTYVGRELLAAFRNRLERLHEQLRESGIGIFVEPSGRSWQPEGVKSMVVRPWVAKPVTSEVASHG